MMRWSPALPPRPGCPHRRLRHLLTRALPPSLTAGASTFRPWASASFVGARHIFPCALAAGEADATARALQDQLGAAEWMLPGHIVADVVVECGTDPRALRIEILTVED
ncbi:hypothetical protein OVY29_11940 [Sphingopyxis sp. SE2]|jgi:hypothetical protein|uniref:hypothetical protein n=1 Tax=unclassified Sphingopyxis TaxID=2614943 RepID=UPI0005100550|nr:MULTISPECIES: hypothetical protein [unclassified Sphingopyxis]KGB56549.1 hypothetical protein FG95_02234 [Sphingopyxis sp. LC363]MDT7529375.1 hypothetical protein [Sphingopyxis sp. SE2]